MNNEIQKKLIQELKIRNSRLLAPHLLTLFIIFFLLIELHYLVPETSIAYGVVLFSLSGRYLIMKKFFHAFQNKRSMNILFHLLVVSTGLGWGVLFFEVEKAYGLFHVNTLICLGVMFTLMAGGVTAFCSSVMTSRLFIISLATIPFFVMWIKPETRIVAIFLLANGIYQLYHTGLAHKFLKKSILTEYLATKQKDILQEYIDALPGIVGIIDNEGTYVMINNHLNGKVKNKILGTKVGETQKDNPVSLLILDFMKSSDTHITKEVHAHDLTGENWYMVNLKKISSPQEGIIASVLPINDLVKAKSELKIQEARSQYASKLASLGEFSASIAHEVNNPLTIIAGTASQLKSTLRDDPQNIPSLEKLIDKIMETVSRISRIIRSLKMLSGEAGEESFRNTTFRSIVEPALEITRVKVKNNGIDFVVEGTESEVEIFGSEIQLSQVIMNLVSNAIDAVKDSEQKVIEISYHPSIDWLDILVKDSGIGISTEIKNRIMDPFFTTKESHEGTGLGLSISKSIIERHQGSLTFLENEKMTTFRIRLPRMT